MKLSNRQCQRINSFLCEEIERFGHGIAGEEDVVSECWRVFLTAARDYPSVAGCCDFWTFAGYRIGEELEQLRQKRNRLWNLESGMSLDQTIPGTAVPLGTVYFRVHGDFIGGVVLRDFEERQGKRKCRILRRMEERYTDQEIMKLYHLKPAQYYQALDELQAAFLEWLEI